MICYDEFKVYLLKPVHKLLVFNNYLSQYLYLYKIFNTVIDIATDTYYLTDTDIYYQYYKNEPLFTDTDTLAHHYLVFGIRFICLGTHHCIIYALVHTTTHKCLVTHLYILWYTSLHTSCIGTHYYIATLHELVHTTTHMPWYTFSTPTTHLICLGSYTLLCTLYTPNVYHYTPFMPWQITLHTLHALVVQA